MRFRLEVDSYNQWFAWAWVVVGKHKNHVRFKVDTGCNSLVLSHSTLEGLGVSIKEADLLSLSPVSGKLASGDKHTFRKLGAVSLFQDKNKITQICKADAICHSTHETHDLLGTEV